jgi:hypothetical protein
MQFGRALERIITQTVRANPNFGPVQFIKIDLADGFYRVAVRPADIPKLGVAFPSAPGEPPLVAFPLVLPMGWTESPPYFCAATETIADVANRRLTRHRRAPGRHRLEQLANTPSTDAVDTPPVQLPVDPLRYNSVATIDAPTQADPLKYPRARILSAIDIFVDDFIGVAQGSRRRLNRIRRILMQAIDDVFRPLDPDDPAHRREPISVSKLRKGDASWSHLKKVLGWIIDSAAMTLTLPARRLNRLGELLASIHPTQKRLAEDKWHKILGELRSMALALPGARGLFSHLQVAGRANDKKRLRLHKGFHDALQDFRWLHNDLARRPTRLQELVPLDPTLWGTHDASGHGAGGIWLPGPTAIPRRARVKVLAGDGTLRRTRLKSAQPIVWRVPIPPPIQRRLVTYENPGGDVTNSDLELAGGLLHQEAAVTCFDIRERTTKDATDNIATLYWSRKGSTTTTGPAAYLLRLLALHQRHHRYLNLKDYLPGDRNVMADDASRFCHLSDTEFLVYFNSTYPQKLPWALWTPSSEFLSSVTSALRRRQSPTASFLRAPPQPLVTGTSGKTFASNSPWILPLKNSKTLSLSSKSLPTDSAPAPSTNPSALSDLARWKMPYEVLAKRTPQWGPRTHG